MPRDHSVGGTGRKSVSSGRHAIACRRPGLSAPRRCLGRRLRVRSIGRPVRLPAASTGARHDLGGANFRGAFVGRPIGRAPRDRRDPRRPCAPGPCGQTIAIELDGRVHVTAPQPEELGMLPPDPGRISSRP